MKNRIRELRNSLSLNQEEFGEKLGVSRSVIVNAELGRAKLNDLFVRHIADVYHVNLVWLETGKGEMLVQTNDSLLDQLVDKYSLTPMEAGIMAKFIRMDADQRAMFLDIARSLLDAGSQAQSEAVAREVVSRAVPPEPESQIG